MNAAEPRTPTPPPAGAAAWLVALAPTLVALLAALVARSQADLPGTIASHFGPSGVPDGSAPAGLVAALVGVAALGLVPTSWALVRSPDRTAGAPVAAIGTWWAVFMALVAIQLTSANDGVTDWRQADALGAGWLLVVLVVPIVVAGGVAWALRRVLPPEPVADRGRPLPSLGLAPGERASWTEVVPFGWVLAVVLPMAGIGIGLVVAVGGELTVVGGILVLVAALVGVAFSRVTVVANREGLAVRFGLLGWPRVRVPLDEVERAVVEERLRPAEWGGWGYRGSLKVLGTAAVVHRAGPALVLELTEGRRFAVTCDHPEVPAGLLNDLRARVPG